MKKDLIALESDEQNRITRALGMSSAQPIETRGGDVVFIDVLARTDDDQALERISDRPVATTSVYDDEQLIDTLVELGYPKDHAEFAAGTPLGDSALAAAHIAESRDHDHPAAIESVATGEGTTTAMTDGGTAVATGTADEPADDDLPEITRHVEPPEVGGETYVRCEGCGAEQIHGPEHLLHDDDCPHSPSWQDDAAECAAIGCDNPVENEGETCSENCATCLRQGIEVL